MSNPGRNREAALDAVFQAHGGELGWSVFGSGQMTPAEILEAAEAGEVSEFAVKAAVMGVMLDLVLEGFARGNDVERVGVRCLSLARAVRHGKGKGLAMIGARGKLGGCPGAEVARRVLDQWLWDDVAVSELGKRMLAIGQFFNHAELDGVSLTKLAEICGESATWMMKRVRASANKVIEFSGGSGKATWQHGSEQRKESARARKRSFLKSQGSNK